MGHVRVKIRIANPARRHVAVDVDDALVDTGATWTTVPRDIADRLGLDIVDQVRTETAAGGMSVDHSFALVAYDGKQSVSDVLINDHLQEVLVGVVTLEGLRLAIDPGSGRLVDTKLLLM
jgi:aspartyl protease family protein